MDIALLINDPKEYEGSILATYCRNWGSKNNGLMESYKKIQEFTRGEERISHLYFGSEFCEYCIPDTNMLNEFLQICKADNLTPDMI